MLPWLFTIYAIMSVLTLMFYAKDKRAAAKGRWRTREKRLHTLALFGGWFGALIGQFVLRHKSRKPIFVLITWIIVAMHICLIAWLTMR